MKIKDLEKKFGKVFVNADDILGKKRTIFSLSPKLDIALNGGIPSGCWGIISGASKLGKSSLALSICSDAQTKGRKCFYIDVEHRLEKKNLEGIPGLKLDSENFKIITSTTGNILNAETTLDIAETLLKNYPGIVLVLDSSSALCTKKEYEEQMTSTGRHEVPKILAKFTRKLSQIVPVEDSLVIIIQHMMANTSGYGSPWLEDGGNKIIYQTDFKLRGVSFKKWEEDNIQIGQVNNWHVIYSALGQPGAKVENYLRYGKGIDRVMEYIDLACEIGLIEQSGAWFELSFLDKSEKVQGKKRVWEFLNEDSKSLSLLDKKIKEFYIT